MLSYSECYGKMKYKRSLYLDALEAGLSANRLTRVFWTPESVGTPLKEFDPGADEYILDREDFYFCMIEMITVGTVGVPADS